MRGFDFSPLFRSTVGYDRVGRLLDAAMQQGDDFEGAFTRASGTTPKRFEADFLNSLRLRGFRGFGLKVRPWLRLGGPDEASP
jgi:hypothetical protein